MNRRPHSEEPEEKIVPEGFAGRLSIAVLFVTAICFTSSLFFPALRTEDGDRSGFLCLFLGWMPARPLFNTLVWWANPLLIVACVLLWRDSPRQRVAALVASLGALLLACSGFVVSHATLGEGGGVSPVIGRGPGFYLWLLSFPGPFLFFVKRLLREPEPPADDPEEESGAGLSASSN